MIKSADSLKHRMHAARNNRLPWFSAVVVNRWAAACKSGGPQLGILIHKWDTDVCVFFENGFACQKRLSKTRPYEQSYGPAPEN